MFAHNHLPILEEHAMVFYPIITVSLALVPPSMPKWLCERKPKTQGRPMMAQMEYSSATRLGK